MIVQQHIHVLAAIPVLESLRTPHILNAGYAQRFGNLQVSHRVRHVEKDELSNVATLNADVVLSQQLARERIIARITLVVDRASSLILRSERLSWP